MNGHSSTEPQDTMELITTRNGEVEFYPVLKSGMLALRKLYLKSEAAVKDFYGLAKAMDYEADGENARLLYEAGFLDEVGYMHPSCRRLALSAIAVSPEGKVRIVDPVSPLGDYEGKAVDQQRFMGKM